MDHAPTQRRRFDTSNNAPARHDAETTFRQDLDATVQGQQPASSWVSLLSAATAASQTPQTCDTEQTLPDQRTPAATGTHGRCPGVVRSQSHAQQPDWRLSSAGADWAGSSEAFAPLGDLGAAATLATSPQVEATQPTMSTTSPDTPTNEAIPTEDLAILWPGKGGPSYNTSFFLATDQNLLTSSDNVQMLWDSWRL